MTRLGAALFAAAAVCAATPDAHALGEPTNFAVAVIKHGGDFNPRPNALSRLAWDVIKRTSVEVTLDPRPTEPSDPALFEMPFAVLAVAGPLPAFDAAALTNLRRYLLAGGFLLIDSSSPAADASVRAFVKSLFDGKPLVRLPSEHVVYHSFYLLDGPAGRTAAAPYLEGVTLDDRQVIIYSQNDLLGALERDGFGNWRYDVAPGGNRRRELAFRTGVNLVLYALCLDYKDDQVHLPFILRRRR